MMIQGKSFENNHKTFIENIVSSGQVWGVASNSGFVKTTSKEFENVEVIPFWSDEQNAAAVIKNGWEQYSSRSIPLSEFLENWLVGMYNEDILVGTDWNINMTGEEHEPLELAIEIADKLIEAGQGQSFEKYKDINDYQAQVKSQLDLT
jgi:hypothetical protein